MPELIENITIESTSDEYSHINGRVWLGLDNNNIRMSIGYRSHSSDSTWHNVDDYDGDVNHNFAAYVIELNPEFQKMALILLASICTHTDYKFLVES